VSGFLRNYLIRIAERSDRIPLALSRVALALTIGWAGLFFMLAAFRVLASPALVESPRDMAALLFPYAAIALAPLAGLVLTSASYPAGSRPAALSLRLFPFGRWRSLQPDEARRHPLFGPAGFMASLLIGLLLNVVLRSIEFLVAVPALNAHAPLWGQRLFLLMAGDVALMAFLYMVCFALALRTIPLFPRMLAFVWLLDVFIQLFIARRLGATPGLPADVAVPLATLLDGNIKKVLISVFVWLPYLLLSDRVNVTYRSRIRSKPTASYASTDPGTLIGRTADRV
jgi:hypothetical protein